MATYTQAYIRQKQIPGLSKASYSWVLVAGAGTCILAHILNSQCSLTFTNRITKCWKKPTAEREGLKWGKKEKEELTPKEIDASNIRELKNQ